MVNCYQLLGSHNRWRIPAPGTWYPVSGIQVSWHPIPYTIYPTPYTLNHWLSSIQHPAS